MQRRAIDGPGAEFAVIEGTADGDRLNGTRRADEIYGGDGADRIDGEDGADRIDGGRGNDRLEGDDGNDRILGGAGSDRIDGDDGDDTLTGGKGRDTFVFDDDNQRDVVTDFDVADDIIYFDYESRDRDAVYSLDDVDIRDTAEGLQLSFDDNHIVILQGITTASVQDIQFRFNPEPTGLAPAADHLPAAHAPLHAELAAF